MAIVLASMHHSSHRSVSEHYGTFTLKSPKTGRSICVSGFYDGDMCEDIRRKIALATNLGEFMEVPIYLSKEDCFRWMGSAHECYSHYVNL